MKQPLLSLLLFIALFFAAMPTQAVHADGQALVPDATFTTPTNASLSFNAAPLTYVAQTFTAGVNGLLRAVAVDIVTTHIMGEMRVEIMGVTNGLPNGNVLGYGTFSADDLQAMSSGEPLSFNVRLQGDIYVTAGVQYAIIVNYLGYSNTAIPHGVWAGAGGDLYAGGAAFTAVDAPMIAWQPLSGLDLHFRTFVLTGVPVSDLSIQRVSGAKKAHACDIFPETYRITNFGPDPATRVTVGIGGTDQFDFVSVDRTSGSSSEPFDLAVGESRLVLAYYQVTGFVPGESRIGRISAGIHSELLYPDVAFDPNLANNHAPTQIRMVGKSVLSCWP